MPGTLAEKISRKRDVSKRSWGSELNRLYGSSDFDFVTIMIVDNYGNRVMGDVKDVRVVPEPEEEVEE